MVAADTTVAGVEIQAGFGSHALSINAGVTLTVANATISGSNLDGTGTFTVTAAMTWSGGTMKGTGKTVIDAGATLTIDGANAKTLDTRTLENKQTVNVNGTGDLILKDGAMIDNQGTFNLNSQTTIKDGGASPQVTNQIVNSGTFNKSPQANDNVVEVSFWNDEGRLFGADAPGAFTFKGEFLFTGGEFDGGDELIFEGPFNWVSGTMKDSSQFASGSTTFKGSVSVIGDHERIIERSVINEGIFTWIGDNPNLPTSIHLNGAHARLHNLSIMEMKGRTALHRLAGGHFNNTGTLRAKKLDGVPVPVGGPVVINVDTFYNSGLVEVAGLEVYIFALGGDNYHSGEFRVLAQQGTGLIFTNGSKHIFQNPSPGILPGGFTGGGPVTIGPGVELQNNATKLSADYLILQGQFSILSGSGEIEIHNSLQWLDTAIAGAGTVTIAATAHLELFDDGPGENRVLNGRHLTILGTATWWDGNLRVLNGSIITLDGQNVADKGVLDIQCDKAIKDPNAGKAGAAGNIVLKNGALLKKSDSPTDQPTVIEPKLDIQGGKVDQMGHKLIYTEVKKAGTSILDLNGGEAVVLGDFQQNGGSTAINGGSLTIGGTLLLNGGAVSLSDGNLTAAVGVGISSSGILSGPGTITADVLNEGTLVISNAYSGDTLTIDGDYTQVGGYTTLNWHTLVVTGTLHLDGAPLTVQSATLDVGGTLLVGSGAALSVDNGDITASAGVNIASSGTLSGYGTLTADLVNAGTVESGTLYSFGGLTIDGDYTQTGGSTTLDWQSLTVSGDLSLNGGLLTVGSGQLQVTGEVDIGSGGALELFYGTITAGGGLFIDAGGTLSGLGAITGNVSNAGTLTLSSADLTIYGNYTQTSTGVLNLEGWTSVWGNGATMLNISGSATLDGTLNFSVSGDPPDIGAVFTLLSFSSRSGSFATLNLPPPGSGMAWDARFDDPWQNTFNLWVIED